MKLENIFILLAIAILFCMALTVIHYCPKMCSEAKSDSDTVVVHDTVIIFKTDTMKIVKPKLVLDTIIRRDTIKSDTVLTFEQKVYSDTICNNSDSVVLTSFISGISAQQDSVKAIWKKQEKIVTNTIVVTEKKHFSWGIQVGYGYGLNTKQFEPYAGFGFNYNF